MPHLRPAAERRPGARAHRSARRRAAAPAAVLIAGVLVAAACTSGGSAAEERRGRPSTTVPVSRAPRGAEPPAGTATAATARATQIALFDDLVTGFTADRSGSELLIAERAGIVHRLTRERRGRSVVPVLDPTPALDLRDLVSVGVDRHVERGFYDLAVTPDGSGLLVTYRRTDQSLVLEHYDYRPGSAVDPATRRTILALPWQYPYHHGAGLTFEDDGDVLMGIGDEALALPGVPMAQDPTLIRGGVLRVPAAVIADRSSTWRPTPADMPVRGLRHPWRLEIDPATGDLWIGDFGNGRGEEIDRVTAADLATGGVNLGWPYLLGDQPVRADVPDGFTAVAPIIARAGEDGSCGLVGGFVYRGRLLAPWAGRYLYGDRCNGEVRALEVDADGRVVADETVATVADRIVSFGEGPGGEVYVLGQYGGLFRLDPAGWAPEDNWQPGGSPPTSAVDHQLVTCGIVPALAPLGQIGSLPPDQMRVAMAAAKDAMAVDPPTLPEHLRPARAALRQVIVDLDAVLASVGYDLAAHPRVAADIRAQAMSATGIFAPLPRTLEQFLETECQ